MDRARSPLKLRAEGHLSHGSRLYGFLQQLPSPGDWAESMSHPIHDRARTAGVEHPWQASEGRGFH